MNKAIITLNHSCISGNKFYNIRLILLFPVLWQMVKFAGIRKQLNRCTMRLTFYGHACFMVEVNGKKLLFDPSIAPNELAKDININDIEAGFILLSEPAAAKMVKCDTVIGVHYDTFGFIKIDHAEAKQAFKNNGIQLLLPAIGETIDV